jgi:hypothetical protein
MGSVEKFGYSAEFNPSGFQVGYEALCSPVTEFWNASANLGSGYDYFFLSTQEGHFCVELTGCWYGFSGETFATYGLAAGGTGGIIVDNAVGSGNLAGASQVYYTTLGNGTCATSGVKPR